MRSLWLAKKDSRSVALRIVPKPEEKRVDFEMMENIQAKDVKEGTVKRGSATCPCCGFTTPVASVRKQIRARRGGATDAQMFCVVTTKSGKQGRFYRLPTKRDIEAVQKAVEELERRKKEHKGELNEFFMQCAPGLLKEFLDRPEIKQTMDEVVTEGLTSNNDNAIKLIL